MIYSTNLVLCHSDLRPDLGFINLNFISSSGVVLATGADFFNFVMASPAVARGKEDIVIENTAHFLNPGLLLIETLP